MRTNPRHAGFARLTLCRLDGMYAWQSVKLETSAVNWETGSGHRQNDIAFTARVSLACTGLLCGLP